MRLAAGLCAVSLALVGCGAGGDRQADSHAADPETPRGGLKEPFRTLEPEVRVPSFRVRSMNGQLLDFDEMMGPGPVVIVFFASWCQQCSAKMPLIMSSLEKAPPKTQVIGVTLDEPDTMPAVEGFAEEHGFEYPIVQGARFADFTLAYDPQQIIPVVVVIGRDGNVVDYQMGNHPDHARYLPLALEIAGKEPARSDTLEALPTPGR